MPKVTVMPIHSIICRNEVEIGGGDKDFCGRLIIFPTTWENVICPECKAEYNKVNEIEYKLLER